MAQFIGRTQEAVANAWAFLLVAELLERVRQQILGCGVGWLGIDQLVEEFHGLAVLALVIELLALGKDLLRATHHFHIQRRRVAW